MRISNLQYIPWVRLNWKFFVQCASAAAFVVPQWRYILHYCLLAWHGTRIKSELGSSRRRLPSAGWRATLQEAVLIEPRATLSHCLTDMPALATMRSALHCDDVLGLELVPRESMLTYITGPYSLSCQYKIFKQFGICPIILWYLGHLKQEKTKKFNDRFFQEDRLKVFLL